MCEVRSKKKQHKTNQKKKKYSDRQRKEMDCDEPHQMLNEKTQSIQWTERPTGALVAVSSPWPELQGIGLKLCVCDFQNWNLNFVRTGPETFLVEPEHYLICEELDSGTVVVEPEHYIMCKELDPERFYGETATDFNKP